MKKKNSDYIIRYSNCWEDPEVLLNVIRPTDLVALSIASAGDNTFSLLTATNLTKVYAFDYNPHQIALMKLKACGIKYLSYEEFLILIGAKEGDSLAMYEKIHKHLSVDVTALFDNNITLIKDIKLIHCGRFEGYFQKFKQKVLRLTHSKKTIERFMEAPDLKTQYDVYRKKFCNLRFKIAFNIFFSKRVMGKYGREKSYFDYAKDSLQKHLKERLALGFQNVLNKENPYMQYIIYNRYNTLPHYLQEENFNAIKANIDKIEFITGDLKTVEALNIKFDFANLSDIFEYMKGSMVNNMEAIVKNLSNPKARIVFWNMLVRRKFFSNAFVEMASRSIFKNDKVFFYRALRLYEVVNND